MSEPANQNGYPSGFEFDEKVNAQKGRIPLDAPVYALPEPSGEDEFAKNATEIAENFRFYGILMKKEDDGFKRIETITRSNAKCLDEVRSQYGEGAYQLRFNTDEGQKKIDFSVKQDHKMGKPTPESDPLSNQRFLISLRTELKDEIRGDYEADIQRLQARIGMKEDELDDKSRKIRDLNEEIGSIRNQIADRVKLESDPLRAEIKALESEKWDLKDQIRELKTELQLSGEEPEGLGQLIIQKLTENPELLQLIAPPVMRLLGVKGTEPVPLQQLQNPQAGPQVESQPQPQSESQPEPEPDVNTIIQTFANKVIQSAVQQLVTQNPSGAIVKNFVDLELKKLSDRGIKLTPDLWVGMARGLMQVARQHKISSQKVAFVITPILSQFGQAQRAFQNLSPHLAANLLISMYNLEIEQDEKEYLIDVLKAFKELNRQAV